MSRIHIHRPHHLEFAAARKVAWKWAEQAEAEFDMECSYAEGKDGDEVYFKRSGASGVLRVDGSHFELEAKLGILLGAFKDQIEAEIVKNLDTLLSEKPSRKLAQATAKKTPAKKKKTA